MNGTWRSLVARLTGGQEVAGSNPVVPTGLTTTRYPKDNNEATTRPLSDQFLDGVGCKQR